MACSHPGGQEGLVCSPLPFLWGTNSRLGCVALVRLYGLLVGLFGLGSVASTEPRLLGTATVQQAWRRERAEPEARLLVTELLVAERCGLATTHLDSLTPSSEDPGMNPAAFSCFALSYDDLCQPIPAPGIVAIANNSRCAVPQLLWTPLRVYKKPCSTHCRHPCWRCTHYFVKTVSQDQIHGHERGHRNMHFPCSADHEHD